MSLDPSQWRCRLAATFLVICPLQVFTSAGLSFGQEEEKPAAEESQATEESSEQSKDEPDAAEEDPYAIPENATVEELFEFIGDLKKIRPPERTYQSSLDTAKKVFPTILEVVELVIEKSEDPDEIAKAVTEKFAALNILSRYDRSVKPDLLKLAEENADNDNREIAVTASGLLITEKVSSPKLTLEQAQEAASDLIAFVDKFGLDMLTYRTVSGVARNLGYGEHKEVAAKLYEDLAPLFRESEESSLADRAETMIGAARRLRLPGNTMEVFGTTAEGESFEWADYKGKVVLVDFWASWCGPCLSELPNMKKNLELYQDRGFEIVGINMDSTRDRFEKCVEDKEISWVNICSDDEELAGWKAPMATHYGITGIPTAILVDGEGHVVSLRARGGELNKLLEELLGPPAVEEAEEATAAEDAAEGKKGPGSLGETID